MTRMKAYHRTGLFITLLSTAVFLLLPINYNHLTPKDDGHFRNLEETANETDFNLLVKPATAASRKQNNTRPESGKYTGEIKQLRCRILPDVLIIGFEKCGTGTLRRFLRLHPDIWVKEGSGMNKFFSYDYNKTLKEFAKGRDCIPRDKLLLEKLAVHGLPELVYEYIPNVILIAIVKEPSERVVSLYLHRVAYKLIPPGIKDFEAYVKSVYVFKNQSVLDKMVSWDPKHSAKHDSERSPAYFNRLKLWVDVFGLDKILILDGDAFAANPVKELRKAETFIGLEHKIKHENFYFNEKKGFNSIQSNRDDGCMQTGKGRPHPDVKNSTRKILKEFFKPHNERFYELIGRTFPRDN